MKENKILNEITEIKGHITILPENLKDELTINLEKANLAIKSLIQKANEKNKKFRVIIFDNFYNYPDIIEKNNYPNIIEKVGLFTINKDNTTNPNFTDSPNKDKLTSRLVKTLEDYLDFQEENLSEAVKYVVDNQEFPFLRSLFDKIKSRSFCLKLFSSTTLDRKNNLNIKEILEEHHIRIDLISLQNVESSVSKGIEKSEFKSIVTRRLYFDNIIESLRDYNGDIPIYIIWDLFGKDRWDYVKYPPISNVDLLENDFSFLKGNNIHSIINFHTDLNYENRLKKILCDNTNFWKIKSKESEQNTTLELIDPCYKNFAKVI